ncbi:MAG: hypothetical protein JSR77_00375 [Planctomycetes bacterium]|nr:hypothetical protein [Planctomycetota bacterium]
MTETNVIAMTVAAQYESADDAPTVHRIISPSGDVFGAVAVLDPATATPARLDAIALAAANCRRLILRFEPNDDTPAWLPEPRRVFEQCAQLLQSAAASHSLEPVIWPLAGAAVSDAPSIATFLRSYPAWRFIFDPAALLVPDMLDRAQEHLTRLHEALGSHDRIAAAVIGVPTAIRGKVIAVHPGDGPLAAFTQALRIRCLAPETPLLAIQ